MNARGTTILLLVATLGVAGCSSKKSHADRNITETANNPTVSFPGPGTSNGVQNLISSISPAAGPPRGGTVVTITGEQFYGSPTVEFGGTAATEIAVASSTSLTCKTPAHAEGMVDVVLVLENGQNGRLNNGFFFDPSIGAPFRVADYGNPTGEEQEFIELINQGRRDPTALGQRLGLDLSSFPVTAPVSHNEFLHKAGSDHATDMAVRSFYGHVNPDGDNANGRVLDSTYDLHGDYGVLRTVNFTENIGASTGTQYDTAQEVFDLFILETGSSSTKHREMILGFGAAYSLNREFGVALDFRVANAQYDTYATLEGARTKTDKPMILGVVYNDDVADGLARDGEGRSGVVVKLSDNAGFELTTESKNAGGFAFEVFLPGTYTITIDGVSTDITVADKNVKVDLRNGGVIKY